MKRIGWMIISSFSGPFLLNFIIWMLILDMQFLWLYVDDLMGKGLEWNIILELLLYASANWVPLALPLSVLLASIMSFGSLGEKNELLALKAAGISLFKIMRPLIVVVFMIAVFAFYFTNNLWPVANFKMRVLLRDIQNTKVALVLQPGVFFKSDNFSIRIGDKNKGGNEFSDILIYDHSNMNRQSLGAWSYKSDPRDYKRVIRAKKGKLVNPEDKSKLSLELEDGYMIQEWDPKSFKESNIPFTKYNFKQTTISFEMNAFEFQRSSEKSYQKEQYLLNLSQLYKLNDSVNIERKKRYDKIAQIISNEFYLNKDSSLENNQELNLNFKSIFRNQSKKLQKKNFKVATKRLDQLKNHIRIAKSKEKSSKDYLSDLKIEWNRKFTLSYAVLMLFFLGGPLGAIVKKGGLGWPVITAILIFLVYFILTRAGEEMAANYNLGPNIGMWLSAICITPVSIFIFYKANQDARIFDTEWYNKMLRKIVGK